MSTETIPPAESQPASTVSSGVTGEDAARIDDLLRLFAEDAELDMALVVNRSGALISGVSSDDFEVGVTLISSLVATASEIIKDLITELGDKGEIESLHQGSDHLLYCRELVDQYILVGLTHSRLPVGIVRQKASQIREPLTYILKNLAAHAQPDTVESTIPRRTLRAVALERAAARAALATAPAQDLVQQPEVVEAPEQAVVEIASEPTPSPHEASEANTSIEAPTTSPLTEAPSAPQEDTLPPAVSLGIPFYPDQAPAENEFHTIIGEPTYVMEGKHAHDANADSPPVDLEPALIAPTIRDQIFYAQAPATIHEPLDDGELEVELEDDTVDFNYQEGDEPEPSSDFYDSFTDQHAAPEETPTPAAPHIPASVAAENRQLSPFEAEDTEDGWDREPDDHVLNLGTPFPHSAPYEASFETAEEEEERPQYAPVFELDLDDEDDEEDEPSHSAGFHPSLPDAPPLTTASTSAQMSDEDQSAEHSMPPPYFSHGVSPEESEAQAREQEPSEEAPPPLSESGPYYF